MRRWFLSYNSQDLTLMRAFETALRRKDAQAHIFSASSSLRAGGFWLPELAKEIAAATAFVLLVGKNGVGPWQIAEYYEAIDRRIKEQSFPVILVLLDSPAAVAPGLPFLRQLHWIISQDPASEKSIAQIIDAVAGGGGLPSEPWRHTAPYRGLAAMTEADSDFFFGRTRETVEVIRALEACPDKFPVLLGNSGVGKSSLAQAGVLAAFVREAWPETAEAPGPWPQAFHESRGWCVLTLKPGTEPVRALVEPFLRTWQFDAVDPTRARLHAEWVGDLLAGAVTLRDLLDATELRYRDELHQPKPSAFLLYIDQGEELYVRSQQRERRRFSQVLAEGLADPRLRALMSLRADFLGELQKDEALDDVSRKIEVKPLRETQLREVVSKPAALLGARFETDHLPADIACRAAEESSKDAGALPLLSYLLDDMWKSKDPKWDGILRLPAPAIELGRVLVDRADAFIATHPDSENNLRRIFALKLATVRADGEPTRRRAARSEFTDEEWRLVSELADYPNRLLVTAAPEGGETCAEVAHEAIFRRWGKLKEWITAEREYLIWKGGLESDRRVWDATVAAAKADALLMGVKLAQAQTWLAARAQDLSDRDRQFIEQSIERDTKDRAQRDGQRRRIRQMALLVGVLVVGIGAGLAWTSRAYLQARAVTLMEAIWPRTLSAEQERALVPKQAFKECAHCPEMVMVTAGQFMMGSLKEESGHRASEEPRHLVTIARPFAVSRVEVTSEEWDACVLLGGCSWRAPDTGWGRGRRPVMNVSWAEAQQYMAWLSQHTGKRYRLLSEAEWEYGARAGSDKAYSWGEEIGKNNANCNGCSSEWDLKQTAPVGSFAANAFGLHDMHGNVFEWTQDCAHDNYNGAPVDGSAWEVGGDCSFRVVRGGSWVSNPRVLRSAVRNSNSIATRYFNLGFRVGRTITP
jgi:formylglycine-generating enzyme required for sulfatase activity